MTKEMTKSLPVSKWMVYNSYLKVIEDGSAGINKEGIELFHENLSANLNKIWNCMTSGSYFPLSVLPVFIPGKRNRKRPLGISEFSDRIAEGVVRDYLEPSVENIFHPGSFGYRPARSVQNATRQCQGNCIKYAWVIHVNIKEFFDHISHDILLQLLQKYTQEEWIVQYTEQWLKAGVKNKEGSIASGNGIPGGGIISPLFANIYLHHSFDKWMDEEHAQNPFERYADDIAIHCSSKEEARELLEKLKVRMQQYKLDLHPEKTKVVYCRNHQRNDRHTNNSFTFLNYSFQPETAKDRFDGKSLRVVFNAVNQQAKTNIGTRLRAMLTAPWSNPKH